MDGLSRQQRAGQGSALAPLLVIILVVAGCTRLPWSEPALQTVDAGDVCGDIGLEGAILRGSPTDPHIAWIEDPQGRREVVFPGGFTARFAPALEVLDESGTVVLREGDGVSVACVRAEGLLLGWP